MESEASAPSMTQLQKDAGALMEKSSDAIVAVAAKRGHRSHASTNTIMTTSTTFSVAYSELEKGFGVLEDEAPRDFYARLWADLRYRLFIVYHRLFGLVAIGNLAAFIWFLTSDHTYDLINLVNAAAANLLACGLARQPLVVNSLYVIFCAIPRSWPAPVRHLACKIFHIGGVHSGAGVMAAVWYLGFVGVYTRQFALTGQSIPVLVLAYVILALLIMVIVVAFPPARRRFHDVFELAHRFSVWVIVALFWALLLTFANSLDGSLGMTLIQLPVFWMTIVLTLALVHPWILLRKVKVTPEELSAHAIRLHFDHANAQFGQGVSFARHPLRDWHSFASFVDRHDSPEHKFSCLVSKAGDWTTDVIKNPPTHLWKRGVPIYGFGYVMRVFTRVIMVTTGSGIGPCLSFIGYDDRPQMRLVWQTRSPLRTYGERTMDLVHQLDPNPEILDSRISGGRVNMLPLVMRLFTEFEAEAVCVISNPTLTAKVVFECNARGIPAYGPIFDS